MNTVTIRNITLGAGKPKICLPIIGKTLEEINSQATEIIKHPVDIIEWRADFFEGIHNISQINKVAASLREIIGEIPLLFTIRTANEGGELSITFEEYSKILTEVSQNKDIDAIDVEIMIAGENPVTDLIKTLKENVAVIASNHNFTLTPNAEEIKNRLKYMETCQADVCKIAVMPKSTEDLLTLLAATNDAHKEVHQPLITMSMGQAGLISRLCGEVFGSALTFGCVGQASAPGQINADQLATVLDILHENL